ncbi:MAG: terminase large subunit [Actinomycetota bacterium]|nr:terminase large subunit [Actinomycetota bacterium]
MTLDTTLDLLASLTLEDGRAWGAAAAEFQRADATAVLNPAPPHSHFLTRPRGGSKTTDVAGVALVDLIELAPPASRGYCLAADAAQAALLLDALGGFVRRTPGLATEVEVQTWRVLHRRSGASLTVLPADAAGAWGLRPRLVVVDELAQWKDTANARGMWEATASAMGKVPGARLLVITSAGDPAHWSAKILAHARSLPDRWRVSETPGPLPWVDPSWLAEQRALLPESQYRRLHLNEWAAGEDRIASADDLAACVVLEGPLPARPGERYVIGLDVGLKRDRTVAAVCHSEALVNPEHGTVGQRVVLDRMHVWSGTRDAPVLLDAVEQWVAQASALYNGARAAIDPWQAIGLGQRLRERKVAVDEFTFSSSSVGQLALTLHQLIRAHALALPDDQDLLDELANVRLVETAPGVLRMDHDAGRHDDRAVAIALAAHRLLTAPPPARNRVQFRRLM